MKTTSEEDKLNYRPPTRKITSQEDSFVEDNLTRKQPQRPYTKISCPASKFFTELGPAQPQLVSIYLSSNLS